MAEQKKWVWKTPPWVPGHIERYLTDPEGAHLWDASVGGVHAMLPTLLLTTTGRKSGEPRHSPLLYQPTGDAYVVIGSKGGFPTDPAGTSTCRPTRRPRSAWAPSISRWPRRRGRRASQAVGADARKLSAVRRIPGTGQGPRDTGGGAGPDY